MEPTTGRAEVMGLRVGGHDDITVRHVRRRSGVGSARSSARVIFDTTGEAVIETPLGLAAFTT